MATTWRHVWSADEKLQLTVPTTAPALQFYSGNFGGTPSREHEEYADWQGLALESFYRTAPNHPEWRSRTALPAPGVKSIPA